MTLACPISVLHDFLRNNNALVVHFSGAPPGVPALPVPLRYPDDLRAVLAGSAQTGIACSLVRPGDTFVGVARHALGCIGVVVDLEDQDSLIAVSATDLGSQVINGIRQYHPMNVTLQDCVDSLLQRGRAPGGTNYNEWGLKNFKPMGIFVAEPFEIYRQMGVPDVTTVQNVAVEFPGWPIYSFAQGGLYSQGSPYLVR